MSQRKVEFYRHFLGETEAASWRKVLDTLFLTLGPQVAAFESELAQFLVRGRDEQPPMVVGTNSCSMGLLITLAALDVGPGDEIITTPMTFASSTNAIIHRGATPILVDVDPKTGLIDPQNVKRAITARTKGILPVHLYGQLADMPRLRSIANTHGLFIVEDSAHGVEIEREGLRPGDLGDAAVFSFYATKTMTSGDGGAVVTRSAKLAERLKRLRNHGVSKAAADRHTCQSYQHWDLIELGYKANLTDLDAAILRPQVPRIMERRDRRFSAAMRYRKAFNERLPAAILAPSAQGVGFLPELRGDSSHHVFAIQVPSELRDPLLVKLGAAGIGTAVNFRAIHTLTYLVERLHLARGSLPIAEEIGDRTISLPIYPDLQESEQAYVIDSVVQSLSELVGRAHD